MIGTSRELVEYDIYHDSWIIRHDILSKIDNIQMTVSQMFGKQELIDQLLEIRARAATELRKCMKKNNVKEENLIILPEYPEYSLEKFLSAA